MVERAESNVSGACSAKVQRQSEPEVEIIPSQNQDICGFPIMAHDDHRMYISSG